MNRFTQVITVVVILVGIVNVAVAAVWWNLIEVTASAPAEDRGFTLSTLSLQLALFEVILIVLGLALAVLGLFSYTEIRRAAVDRAVEAAREEVTSQLLKLQRETYAPGRGGAKRPISDPSIVGEAGSYTTDEAPRDDAVKAGDE